MSDAWLEHGHGRQPTGLATVFSSDREAHRPSPATTLEGTTGAGGRSSRVLVATALWITIVAGTGGAAWAVRDALFPSIGPAAVSIWQNPGREAPPVSEATTSTPAVVVPPTSSDVPNTDVTTPTSIENHADDSPTPGTDDRGRGHDGATTSSVAETTQSTVDDHGGGGGSGDSGSSDGSGSSHGGGSSGGSGASGDSGSSGGSGAGGGSDD